MPIITGPWRKPTNTAADQKGGIHDDATAQNLGFAGGTVAGNLHMEQFPPLLLEHFGESWWQTGNLSLYFMSATQDMEPVRCFLEAQSDDASADVRVWMENKNGDRVMAGTAGIGSASNSEIATRLANLRPAHDLRMLADVRLGDASPTLAVTATDAMVAERMKVITEPLPCYQEGAHRVLPIAPLVQLFRGVEAHVAPVRGPFVGLYGAIEIEYYNGPIASNNSYNLTGKAIGVSESPKTEVLWYEAVLSDPATGAPAARMIKMDRVMKAASPLWTEEA